jgi:hypothetical protein
MICCSGQHCAWGSMQIARKQQCSISHAVLMISACQLLQGSRAARHGPACAQQLFHLHASRSSLLTRRHMYSYFTCACIVPSKPTHMYYYCHLCDAVHASPKAPWVAYPAAVLQC